MWCLAQFDTKEKLAFHFFGRHVYKFYGTENAACPFCKRKKSTNIFVHVTEEHRTNCALCGGEKFELGGPAHGDCRDIWRKIKSEFGGDLIQDIGAPY